MISRHGVRSPTDPNELSAYAARPWPVWEVPPGYLTPNGAKLMSYQGASYRAHYAAQGLFSVTGCPPADHIYFWADVDERTKATASALLQGFAPGCGFTANDAGSTSNDPLFHSIPALGTADPGIASASVLGSIGGNAEAIVPAYRLAFSKLDAILGCGGGACTPISSAKTSIQSSTKSGLTGIAGPVDLASTAVEDFILAYADGKSANDVGWGAVDRETLLELSQLHVLKSALTTQVPYTARVQGSNLLAHVLATLDQGATGVRNPQTRAPVNARFVAFVGHDTNLESIAGMLRLRWLMPGYQPIDTPPGAALVFEVYASPAGAAPFVRLFLSAQSLDQMRNLSRDAPTRVPVFIPAVRRSTARSRPSIAY